MEKELRIGVIHAAAGAVEPLNKALHRSVPGAKVINFMNEEMLQYVNRIGYPDPFALRMFAEQVFHTEEAKADLIIVACNVFAAHTEKILPFISVPLITADGAMQEQAVRTGRKIGLIGTNTNAVPSCIAGMKQAAEKLNISCPEFVNGTVIEAAEALTRGDTELFDHLVSEKGRELAGQGCDVIVLSQITLSRSKPALLKAGITVPVLTTPDACAEQAAAIVSKLR